MVLRRLTRLAILVALCVVMREAFAGIPNVQPVTATFLVVTSYYGLLDGILLSGLTMLVTGFFLGFGEIVPRQILAFALICLIWRLIFPVVTKIARSTPISVVLQALVAGLLAVVYGIFLDFGSALIYHMPLWAYLLNGFYFNLAHALSTSLFYPIIQSIFRRFSHEETT